MAEISKARSESPDIVLASDDSSSLVKNGSPEYMEMDDEIVDQVDAVIAALQNTGIKNRRVLLLIGTGIPLNQSMSRIRILN